MIRDPALAQLLAGILGAALAVHHLGLWRRVRPSDDVTTDRTPEELAAVADHQAAVMWAEDLRATDALIRRIDAELEHHV